MTQLEFSVCLCCGSRKGAHPSYIDSAIELGGLIAKENWKLIYGGGNTGLMGAAADSACTNNGKVLGIIPEHLIELEVAKTDLETMIVTETMHERKKIMFHNSDAIIVLPGGIGTLEELFEILTWKQLELHLKPIVLVNVNNYWKKLNKLIKIIVSEKFADDDLQNLFWLVNSPHEAVCQLRKSFAKRQNSCSIVK